MSRATSNQTLNKETLMTDPKTTIAGILTVAAAVFSVVAAFLTGGDIASAITTSLVPALAGIGLIGASDSAS